MLDRDGVINEDSSAYIKSVAEWHPLPGAIDAMARLHRAGCLVSICTNQSGLRRGLFSEADLDAIHRRLESLLSDAGGHLAALSYCPHGPDDGCRCRKPAPGMLLDQLRTLKVSARNAVFIGDSQRDLEAAKAAGIPAWLVRTGNGAAIEQRLRQGNQSDLAHPSATFDSLVDAVDAALRLPETMPC